MNNHQILQKYSQSIQQLKEESSAAGISENEFKKIYFETLKSHENMMRLNRRRNYKKCIYIIVLAVIALYLLYYWRSAYSYWTCNLQDFIYPGLRLIRKISIPFISLFPALTAELYQEPCLIQNPFFTVVDMDCWPCSTVNNIRLINDPQPVHQQHSAPFIYETEQNSITMQTLQNIYLQNKQVFDSNAQTILKNGKFYISPKDLFEDPVKDDNNLYIWKFTNFNLARILRQIIFRPKVVPKFGQSTERFIIIDSSQNQFYVPDTECNYSFLLSLSGTRIVDLHPAEECKSQCKSLQVQLKESYLLWYNWWYWRPVVQHSSGNSTFIAHVGSYC